MLTESELIQKIWDIEGVKIGLTMFGPRTDDQILVFDDYPYKEPMDGNCTVDDLRNMRIIPILETRRYISKNECTTLFNFKVIEYTHAWGIHENELVTTNDLIHAAMIYSSHWNRIRNFRVMDGPDEVVIKIYRLGTKIGQYTEMLLGDIKNIFDMNKKVPEFYIDPKNVVYECQKIIHAYFNSIKKE